MNMRALVLCFCVVLGGCQASFVDISHEIDLQSFSWFGSTVFSDPARVSMKEVHLESALLLGREVVLEGKVIEVGEYSTYVVIGDKNARMLVVLTELSELELRQADVGHLSLRVLGSVNSGKKGLPYIQARALSRSGKNLRS